MVAVDRISMLPDEVLYHILSFLPTQMAVETSILSKRWKPLWLSVHTLFFDDESFVVNCNWFTKFIYAINGQPYHFFTKFIYATILSRDVPITTFSLQCQASNADISHSDLQIWVNAAIQRGLENLYIRLPLNRNQLSWNSCIFGCKTLVVLKLSGLFLDVISFAHLPSLKTLHLDFVSFRKPQYLVSFVDLPSLKTLDLDFVFFPERQYLVDLLAGCPNLECMHLRNIHCHNIHSIPHYNNFKSLSKLVRADIYSVYFDLFVESPKFDKYLDDILLFPNLTHVKLRLEENMSWHLVLAMLKHCPMLQNLVLIMEITCKFYQDLVWIFPCFVPECLFSQLRKCSILNFGVHGNELHFAKYILLNSRVLRTMTVCTRPSSYSKASKAKLLKELSLCPRSSKICELSFT